MHIYSFHIVIKASEDLLSLSGSAPIQMII